MTDETVKTATPVSLKNVKAGTAKRMVLPAPGMAAPAAVKPPMSRAELQAREEAIRSTRRPAGPPNKALAMYKPDEEDSVPDVEETECEEMEEV